VCTSACLSKQIYTEKKHVKFTVTNRHLLVPCIIYYFYIYSISQDINAGFVSVCAFSVHNYFGNSLLKGVCIRLTWHLHNHDKFYACLWQLPLSVIRSVMIFLMQIWHCLRCLIAPWRKPIHHNLSVSLSWQLDITKTTQPVINMT